MRLFRNGSTPAVLLVHDAFADTSSWAGVIDVLTGLDVTAVANPLRALSSDAAYVAAICAGIDGPVVLVGHGYGGAVITAACPEAANVVGLVYVAGLIPDVSESTISLIRAHGATSFLNALRPTSLRLGGSVVVELSLDRSSFAQVFAADVPAAHAAAAAAAQRPVTATALEGSPAEPGWRAVPCWSLITTEDQVIDVRTQRMMAARARAVTTETLASHAVLSSDPGAVGRVIRASLMPPGRAAVAGELPTRGPPIRSPSAGDLPILAPVSVGVLPNNASHSYRPSRADPLLPPEGNAMASSRVEEATARSQSPLARSRRRWGWVLADGLLGIVVGVFALATPGLTVLTLAVLLGLGLVVQGTLQFTAGTAMRAGGPGRAWSVFFGLVAVVAGVICLARPGAGLLAIIIGVTLWFFVAGFNELVAAFTMDEGRVLNAVLGIITIASGFVLVSQPGIALSTAAFLTGILFVIRGAGETALAGRLRRNRL